MDFIFSIGVKIVYNENRPMQKGYSNTLNVSA